jgi:hypothetical protein
MQSIMLFILVILYDFYKNFIVVDTVFFFDQNFVDVFHNMGDLEWN